MAQWSLLGREPLLDFPAIRYPGFSDRLRSSHTLRGPIFAALVSQRDFNACIPRLSAKLVVSDRCPRADTGSAIADAHGDYRFFRSPPRFKKPTIRPYRRQSPGHRYPRHSLAVESNDRYPKKKRPRIGHLRTLQ